MPKKSREARRARREEREKAEAPQIQDERSALVRFFDHIAEKGIYAIILFAPLAFFPQTFWPFDAPRVGVFWILTTLVLTAYLCRTMAAGEWSIAKPSMVITIAIVLYLLAYTVSTVLSISPELSLFSGEGRNLGLISLISTFLLFFMIIHIMRERKQLMRCLQLFLISSTVVAILSLYQYYDEIKDAHFYIILGLASVVTATCLGLVFMGISKRSKRLATYTLLFLISLAIVISIPFFYEKVEGIEGTYYGAISAQALNQKITDPQLHVQESPAPGGFDVVSGKLGMRASAPFGNPDFLIMFIVLPISIAYAYVLRRQWMYVLPLLLLLLCLALSIPTVLSGHHWVDFLVAVGILLIPAIATFIPKRLRLVYLGYLSLVLLVIVCLLSTNAFDIRKTGVSKINKHLLGIDCEHCDRQLLRSIAVDTLDSPRAWIVGSGPNTFRDTFQQYATLEYAQDRPERREDKVHNSFVEALATTGVLGLICYVAALVSVLGYLILRLRGKWGMPASVAAATLLVGMLLLALEAVASIGVPYWVSYMIIAITLVGYCTHWIREHWEKPEELLLAMILVGGLAYTALTWAMFDEAIPYAFFWVLMAIGIGLTVADSPRTVTIRWNSSNIFAYCMVVLIVAAGCFTAYEATRPLAANHYYYRAMYLENTVGATASLPYYKKAIANNPSEVRYLWSYGLALLNEAQNSPTADQYKNCSQCLTAINKAIDKEPESAMLYLNRAQFEYACHGVFESVGEVGMLDTVAADIHKTINMYPTGFSAYRFLAEVETTRGNLEEAIRADETAQTILPLDFVSAVRLGGNHTALGDQLKATGDLAKAQEQYDKAAQILYEADEKVTSGTSQGIEDLLKLGLNHITLGDQFQSDGDSDKAQDQYSRAIGVLESAVSASPQDVTAHQFLGNAYKKAGLAEKAKGEFELALSGLEKLIKNQPNDAYIHYLLGATYEGLDNVEKAKEEYQTTLTLDPNFEKAKEALERLGE